MLYLIKLLVSALLIVVVSEVAKRSGLLGGLIASLPLTSLLGMLWLYWETGDRQAVSQLSTGIFWFVLPSLTLFVVLPLLLKKGMPFYPALGIGMAISMASYAVLFQVLTKLS